MKKAIMLADNRAALVGQLLVQLVRTNDKLFDEAIIVDYDYSDKDKKIMSSLINCRFIKDKAVLSNSLLRNDSFKKFTLAMFARYELFNLITDYELVMWIDTDMLIQGSLLEMIESTKGYDMALLREDPKNKSYISTDYMRTNFKVDLPEYDMDSYLYCTGVMIVRNTLKQQCSYANWCYNKTVEWANILNLPDQGVINALIQEFSIKVKPLGDHGKYGAYPYVGRDCSDSLLIHSWGPNKFWSNYYLQTKYPLWKQRYDEWVLMGGSKMAVKNNPKVSVIIPSYKPDIKYFKESIRSLLKQKTDAGQFSDFEIIIISEPFEQESLKKMVKEFKDSRIVISFNDERKGIAASLNQGIRLAKGDYVARMDDDDISDEYRLYKQSSYLDTHEECSLCTSDYVYFGDMNEGRTALEGELSRAWSLLTCPFDHPTIMFRRSFFVDNDLFYDESRSYVEDWELWQRAFNKGMVVGCLNEVLFYHRWHNGSAGQTNKTVVAMREMIGSNLKELGLSIPSGDLYLFGPWNGKLLNEDDVERLAKYFEEIREANKKCGKYDQKALEKVLNIRMNEAISGDMEIMKKVGAYKDYRTIEKKHDYKNGFKNKIKKIINYFGWPVIKYHLRPVWETHGLAYDINNKVDTIKQTIDGHVIDEQKLIDRKQEQIINNQQVNFDELSRQIQELSNNNDRYRDELSRQIQELSNNNDRYRDEYHRHVDYLYRDIMIALRGVSDYWSEKADLHTDYPIAFDSNDTMFPHGTVRDNTRCPRFIKKCEKVLGKEEGMRFLDLGCSGGGIVLDALLRGHYGLGLEGCDISLRQQRAEWRLIPEHLKTCDIAKPFRITHHNSDEIMLFDVITAWEVLEHIPEERIDQLFENVSNHLKDGGLFVVSIANYPDIDPVSGTNWHVTLHEKAWWADKFKSFGFKLCEKLFDVEDYARGLYNPPNCYEPLPSNDYDDTDYSFHMVVVKE